MNKSDDRPEQEREPEKMAERSRLPLEDLALKAAAQYFGDELLPYLGSTEKLTAVMPTEQVGLLVRHLIRGF